ncbi:DUF2256 domain-containing protein [Meiothermus sp. CFH 77666]|uniref:DUF2256 domain-containing protein n=1 Tax=Meiothermus sp. CFH 77666 TaxID=2817942 RepID=UPI00325FCBCC
MPSSKGLHRLRICGRSRSNAKSRCYRGSLSPRLTCDMRPVTGDSKRASLRSSTPILNFQGLYMRYKGFKTHLPVKVCPVCGRPFQWRKKWAQNWPDVKYCSERCRGQAKGRKT